MSSPDAPPPDFLTEWMNDSGGTARLERRGSMVLEYVNDLPSKSPGMLTRHPELDGRRDLVIQDMEVKKGMPSLSYGLSLEPPRLPRILWLGGEAYGVEYLPRVDPR